MTTAPIPTTHIPSMDGSVLVLQGEVAHTELLHNMCRLGATFLEEQRGLQGMEFDNRSTIVYDWESFFRDVYRQHLRNLYSFMIQKSLGSPNARLSITLGSSANVGEGKHYTPKGQRHSVGGNTQQGVSVRSRVVTSNKEAAGFLNQRGSVVSSTSSEATPTTERSSGNVASVAKYAVVRRSTLTVKDSPNHERPTSARSRFYTTSNSNGDHSVLDSSVYGSLLGESTTLNSTRE